MTPDKPDDGCGCLTRRGFLSVVGRGASGLALVGVTGAVMARGRSGGMVWQIDPFLCTQCGRCQTECVQGQSAVRCYHDTKMCGYCDYCFGFFRADHYAQNEGAENQICPTGAITRRLVHEPYYEYTIDESLCIGCGLCVKSCQALGNGSLYLQVQQSLCVGCSECSIAEACPAGAFMRVPADEPYIIKSDGSKQSVLIDAWRMPGERGEIE